MLGGFFDYDGEYKVLGDGSYSIGNTFYNNYYDETYNVTYLVYGKLDMGRKIIEIRFDIIWEDNSSVRNTYVDNFVLIDDVFTELENYISYDLVTLTELHESLSDLEQSEYDNITDLSYINVDNLLDLIEDFVPVK